MLVRKGLHRVFEMQPRWMKAIEYVDPLPKSKRGKSCYWKQNSDIVRMYGHMDDYPHVDQWPEVDEWPWL